ncbi:MAG: hypothetical protein OXL37_07585 [Chloroflexota bacterium]|nr:hypothetical protein [Chloroflexota bacterium]MDE2959404.1 hypothetical protein [Chloroflexota bacterium]
MVQGQGEPVPSGEQDELRLIVEFYDSLTEEEWIAHDEYAYENPYTVEVLVPKAVLHAVRELVARHEADNPEETAASQAWLERKSDGPGNFPPGWNSERVQRLIAEMEAEEANWTEEDEAELQARMKGKTSLQVPSEIVPAIQALLTQHEAGTVATD